MLAENLGYGTGDEGIAKMTADLEKGAIASNVAIEALLAGMQKYDGMMESMANETVEGLWSQIQDVFEINIFRKWGQGLQDGAKRGFGTVTQLLDKAEGALSKFGDMLYELGKTASNWVADKFQGLVDKVLEISDSFEFQNADLKGKISLLWNGLIVDPLKEWWDGGGREKTIETAGNIGKWIGKTLTKGLLAIFGVTDFLDSDNNSIGAGAQIAESFVQGFKENFDGRAITDAFVEAISNVWGALPWWAKVLIGGYGVGKVAGGISNIAGSITNVVGSAKSILGSATNMTGLLGYGANTAINLGAGNLAGGASLGAAGLSAIGLGATAGGIIGGATLIKGGMDLYKGYTTDDLVEANAYKASGLTAIGGVGAGAAAGAAIGSVVPVLGTAAGALIGAGIGGIAGWIGGNKWADEIRKADDDINDIAAATRDFENEEEKLAITAKMVWQNMRDHFGDIKLSMSEIKSLANEIVWADDSAYFDQFNTAAKTAETSLTSLKDASESTNKWMWKASLGLKFTDDDKESIAASFGDYITAAQNYVENKHYEFTAAVSLLVDTKNGVGKSIITSGNAFYGKLQDELDDLGSKLSKKVEIALQDGIITLNEQEEITNLQNQIAEITQKLANAETEAELELIQVKFGDGAIRLGDGNLDLDSFNSLMEQMEVTLSERMAANDEAFKVSVSALKLQRAEGAITQEEYNKQVEALTAGYTATIDEVKARILDVELDIIGDAYASELDPLGLGLDVAGMLQSAIEKSMKEGIHPLEWTDQQAEDFLGVDNLSQSTLGALRTALGAVFDQLGIIDGSVDANIKFGDVHVDGVNDVEGKVKDYVPGTVETTLGVDIKGDAKIQEGIEILAEDFGIPEKTSAMISFLLSADYDVLYMTDIAGYLVEEFGLDKTTAIEIQQELLVDPEITIAERLEILASHFGIPESQAATILWRITGQEAIQNTIDLLVSDFGVPESQAETIALLLTGDKQILSQIDTTTLAAELGVPEDVAETIITKLSGAKSIEEKVSVLGSELVDSTTVDQTITVRLKTKVVKLAEKVKSWFGNDDEDGSGYRGGIFGGDSALDAFARGGLTDNSGIVSGSTRFIRVNEESPEMIIPLSDQRRGRALKLWAQAGNIMGVPGFARGGIVGGGGSDEGIRFRAYDSDESAGGRTVKVDVGGVKLEINVSGSDRESIVEAIKAQAGELADYFVGVIADALETEFENTPVRGGVA